MTFAVEKAYLLPLFHWHNKEDSQCQTWRSFSLLCLSSDLPFLRNFSWGCSLLMSKTSSQIWRQMQNHKFMAFIFSQTKQITHLKYLWHYVYLDSQVDIDASDMLTLCLGEAKAKELGSVIKANCKRKIKDPIRQVLWLTVGKYLITSFFFIKGNGLKQTIVENLECSGSSKNQS